ncbi:hypothetical protein M1141_02790 [Candidatus Marsarchaeota archaeon]|nr:hypothetical protein [Candidatus Marsarchaeota archaeon]
MELSETDTELFYKLHWSLLYFVNKQTGTIKDLSSPSELKAAPLEKVRGIRKKLYSGNELIDTFVKENPLGLSSSELGIVSAWKDFIKGEFFVVKYAKEYAVFVTIDEPYKAYGVVGLKSPIEEMLDRDLPVEVDAVLLPFKGRIIYDGVMRMGDIFFGSGFIRSINESYAEAKHKYRIITSIPFDEKGAEPSDAEKLRFYMKSEHNREEYKDNIRQLIYKDKKLYALYEQEYRRINARVYSKRLRQQGIATGWFAVLGSTIVASGVSKSDVEKTVQKLVPPSRIELVYIFQLKA